MVIDRLENWKIYFSGPAWQCAFDFLTSLKPDAEDQEYVLQGKDIFARIMSYKTRLPDTAVLEAHRRYVDIQTILVADEGIEWFPIENLDIKVPYDMTKDVAFYKRPERPLARIGLHSGIFVTFFPEDAHMTQLMVGDTARLVKKVVVKISYELAKSSLR